MSRPWMARIKPAEVLFFLAFLAMWGTFFTAIALNSGRWVLVAFGWAAVAAGTLGWESLSDKDRRRWSAWRRLDSPER